MQLYSVTAEWTVPASEVNLQYEPRPFKHSLWHLNAEMYFQQPDQMLQTSTDLGTKKETSEVNHQKFLKHFFKESDFASWTEQFKY